MVVCFARTLFGLATNTKVLLVPNEPTMEWKRLILKFAANDRVTYLKGDLRCTTDLARVYAHKASSCFIICNRCVTCIGCVSYQSFPAPNDSSPCLGTRNADLHGRGVVRHCPLGRDGPRFWGDGIYLYRRKAIDG